MLFIILIEFFQIFLQNIQPINGSIDHILIKNERDLIEEVFKGSSLRLLRNRIIVTCIHETENEHHRQHQTNLLNEILPAFEQNYFQIVIMDADHISDRLIQMKFILLFVDGYNSFR